MAFALSRWYELHRRLKLVRDGKEVEEEKKKKKKRGEERERERERVLGLSRRWRDLHIKWLEIYNGRGPEEVPAIRAINKEPSLRDKRSNLLALHRASCFSPPTRRENIRRV